MMFGSQGFEAIPTQGMPLGSTPIYGPPQSMDMQLQGQVPAPSQGQTHGPSQGGMMGQGGAPMW